MFTKQVLETDLAENKLIRNFSKFIKENNLTIFWARVRDLWQ
jgi:hypothetical protein